MLVLVELRIQHLDRLTEHDAVLIRAFLFSWSGDVPEEALRAVYRTLSPNVVAELPKEILHEPTAWLHHEVPPNDCSVDSIVHRE